MGLVNLIYNGKIPESAIIGLGAKKLKSGMFSLAGEDSSILRWHVKDGQAKVKIHSVVDAIRDVDGKSADFGNYHAHFSRLRDGMTGVRVTGNPHPHFSGTMCWGNMGAARDYALDIHDIEIVAGLVASTLNSYFPNDAFSGWWNCREIDDKKMTCIMCGGDGYDYQCSVCRSDLCADCAKTCQVAAERTGRPNTYCKHCVIDKLCEGESCTHKYCWNHPGRGRAAVYQHIELTKEDPRSGAVDFARVRTVLVGTRTMRDSANIARDLGVPVYRRTTGSGGGSP